MNKLLKVALVTGGGSGIGRSTAVEMAKINYRLALIGRRKHKLEEAARDCMSQGLSQENVSSFLTFL